jgi:hypothetical protein
MQELWKKLEILVKNSRLRLPIYFITIISGVIFFIAPSMLVVMLFIFSLGLLTLFENIHPAGTWSGLKSLFPNLIPSKIQNVILIMIRIIFIMIGIYLMLLMLVPALRKFFEMFFH